MRAVAVHRTGETPEVMEIPLPRPAPGEVLVKMDAASVNPIDVGAAEGLLSAMTEVFPLVLGVDGVGRVVEIGEGVTRFEPGDVVYGQFLRAPVGHGTFAEYAVVTESPEMGALLHVPDGLSTDIAAALPTAGMTALGVVETLGLRAGQSILITGATGGVGVFAVQLAAAVGAEVIATARPDADQWIRQLGATRTVDYTNGDTVAQVRRTHPGGIDAFLDLTRDTARFAEYAELVRDGGAAASVTFTAPPELVASERITVTNYQMQDKPDLLTRITAETLSGRITVPIQRTVTLEEAPAALAQNASGGARGKTTIRI